MALLPGCAGPPAATPISPTPQIEAGLSPEDGAQALVLRVIGSAKQSIRLAGYSFTWPAVVKTLLEAKHRGIDVAVLIDDRATVARPAGLR